jgi:P27 family predicted phage terminase small subunit
VPSAELNGEALAEWNRVCDELAVLGRLDKADRAILTLYVQVWATNQAAQRDVFQWGSTVKYSNGNVGQAPFYKVAKETAAQLRGLLADLGLTPAIRAKAKGAGGGTADDPGELPL